MVFFENAHLRQLDSGIQRGLSAKGRQQGIGPFLLNDLGNEFRGDRFYIGGVCQLRIGHDGRRIGVDEHYLVAFLF